MFQAQLKIDKTAVGTRNATILIIILISLKVLAKGTDSNMGIREAISGRKES
jgi:hypothetical protein